MPSYHVGYVLLALLVELIHFGSPELIHFIDLVVELGGQLVALSFMCEFHFVELFDLEFLFTMLPLHTAPFGIHILPFLLVLNHLLIQQPQVVIQAQHPACGHELAHPTQFFGNRYFIWTNFILQIYHPNHTFNK